MDGESEWTRSHQTTRSAECGNCVLRQLCAEATVLQSESLSSVPLLCPLLSTIDASLSGLHFPSIIVSLASLLCRLSCSSRPLSSSLTDTHRCLFLFFFFSVAF